MKKLAILLSLVMVLGLAVSASAADVKVSGELKLTVKNNDEDDLMDSYSWSSKINFASQINDNLKVTLQTNGERVNNAWMEYVVDAVTVKAGRYNPGRGGEVNTFGGATEAVGVTYAFDGGKASAVVLPDDDPDSTGFWFNGSFAPMAGLTVYGDFMMSTAEDANSAYAVEAAYDLAGFTVYGEIGKDAAEADMLAVGVTTTVSAFDLTFDYDVEAEVWEFNAETKYNGLILGVDVTDGEFGGYVTVKF